MEPARSGGSRSSAFSRRVASTGSSSGVRDPGGAIVLADGKNPVDELGDAPPVMLCACSRPALSLMANTVANPGRIFLKCGNPARPPVRCGCYRGIQGCFLWIWEDLLKIYTDAKVAYETRRLEAEKVALARRWEEEVEELQSRYDEQVTKLQMLYEAELAEAKARAEAAMAAAKASARKLKIVMACLVILCMFRMT